MPSDAITLSEVLAIVTGTDQLWGDGAKKRISEQEDGHGSYDHD